MDAAVASAAERHMREVNTIKASAWANLAYLHLQQQHWQQAVANTEQLLKVGLTCMSVPICLISFHSYYYSRLV